MIHADIKIFPGSFGDGKQRELVNMAGYAMQDLTIYRKIIPEKSAAYADFPVSLCLEIREYLNARGIPQLYKCTRLLWAAQTQ